MSWMTNCHGKVILSMCAKNLQVQTLQLTHQKTSCLYKIRKTVYYSLFDSHLNFGNFKFLSKPNLLHSFPSHQKPLDNLQGFFKLVSNDNSPRDAISSSFVSMTWNIEGFSRNLHSLKYFTDQYKPSLVFLSKPQLLQCDASALLKTF